MSLGYWAGGRPLDTQKKFLLSTDPLERQTPLGNFTPGWLYRNESLGDSTVRESPAFWYQLKEEKPLSIEGCWALTKQLTKPHIFMKYQEPWTSHRVTCDFVICSSITLGEGWWRGEGQKWQKDIGSRHSFGPGYLRLPSTSVWGRWYLWSGQDILTIQVWGAGFLRARGH